MIRTPLALIPYLIAVAAVLGGLIWQLGDRVPATGRNIESGSASVGGPFALVDQDGHRRTDADFRGRYRLVYFGYTFCPDVCPTTLAVIADAMTRMGKAGDKIVPIFITLDPARDSPKVLKDYLKSFGPEFVGLTGSDTAIASVAKQYRVYYVKRPLPGGKYAVDHTSAIYLMDPNGNFVAFWNDQSIGPDALANDLKKRV